METGIIAIEKVGEKSTVTRCFCKYPLKLIIPRKVGSSKSDAVWIYTLSYGGGIVSAGIGRTALLAVIPDPVTCFSTARYSQKQVFRVFSDSNLVVVDWITSGRYESGEKWDFELYKSTNHIFLEGDEPLFLDSVLLDQTSSTSITERMQDYHAIAMVIILGPMLKHIQNQVQGEVKQMMSEKFRTRGSQMRSKSEHGTSRPALFASCSSIGPKGMGVVVRIAAATTDLIYMFLRHQLAGLEPFLGAPPYHR